MGSHELGFFFVSPFVLLYLHFENLRIIYAQSDRQDVGRRHIFSGEIAGLSAFKVAARGRETFQDQLSLASHLSL